MKKRMLFICLLAAALISGCTQKTDHEVPEDKEPAALPLEEPENEDTKDSETVYKVEISDKLSDFQFAVNEKVYTLPSGLEEWKSEGWEYTRDDGKEALDTESYLEGEILKKDGISLKFDLVNLAGEKKPLGECYVGGVVLEDEDKEGQVYQMPGQIVLGTSTLDEVTKAYGTPTDQYKEKENLYLTYEFGIYKKADLVFDANDETLQKAVLKNYRDPEEPQEKLNQEIPEQVKHYKAPDAFSEDINQFVVCYDRDFYQLPAPVSEFTKNGWKISEDGSDSVVKSGRHGYITLTKNGQTLYAVVNNYSDSPVPLANSFVTNVHGDFDVTKVPIQIYKGITLGMAEDTMTALLGNCKYEKQEEEKGNSYYIYADEQKMNYTKITADKELKLVREIEVSNSPDSLSIDSKASGEEEADSVEASVMYGDDEFPDDSLE